MPHIHSHDSPRQVDHFHAPATDPELIFHRTELAKQVARDLKSPAGAAGLLLSGPRCIGKSTFVRFDLLPVLQADPGLHLIFIDFREVHPGDAGRAINEALIDALKAHDGVVMRVARSLGLTHVKVGGLEMSVDQASPTHDKATAALLKALYARAGKRLVFVLDEVELSRQTEAGRNTLLALTGAAHALNLALGRGPGVRILATGSREHKLRRMVTERQEPFYAAKLMSLPPLGEDFVEWVRARLPVLHRPDVRLMHRGFDHLLHRPRELMSVCDALVEADLRLPKAIDEVFLLMVGRAAEAGREAFMMRLSRLSKRGLAMMCTIAEFGPRFAPHLDPCQRRLGELTDRSCKGTQEALFSTAEIESALNELAAQRLVWQDSGFLFEEPRASEWLLALNPLELLKAHVEPAASLMPPPGLDFPTLPS